MQTIQMINKYQSLAGRGREGASGDGYRDVFGLPKWAKLC